MWGVDSADLSQNQLPTVIRTYGVPGFYGRYLPDFATSGAEVHNLISAGIPVVPIWNGDGGGSQAGLDYNAGWQQAMQACDAWSAIGCPPKVAIYWDVEQNRPASGASFRGWLEGIGSRGYVGGVYINPPSGFNHAGAWAEARANAKYAGVVWTSQYETFANARNPIHDFVIGGDNAAPVLGWESDTVLWQTYEENGGVSPIVDLDCASPRGMGLMWGAPKPVVTHVHLPNQRLKPFPVNLLPALTGYLQVGTVFTFTGATTPHWAQGTIGSGPYRGKRGWLLRSALLTS